MREKHCWPLGIIAYRGLAFNRVIDSERNIDRNSRDSFLAEVSTLSRAAGVDKIVQDRILFEDSRKILTKTVIGGVMGIMTNWTIYLLGHPSEKFIATKTV